MIVVARDGHAMPYARFHDRKKALQYLL